VLECAAGIRRIPAAHSSTAQHAHFLQHAASTIRAGGGSIFGIDAYDVHAFGYNSAGSERILMKFGELRVYYYKKDIKLIEGVQRRATNRKSICTKIGDLE